MAAGRPAPGGRELVRLTPFQFSLAVAVVVILAAGAYLVGYRRGSRDQTLGQAVALHSETVEFQVPVDPAPSPASTTQPPSVTFHASLAGDAATPGAEGRPASARTASPPAKRQASAPSPASPPRASSGGRVIVQVASYPDLGQAQATLQSLSAMGFKGSILPSDLGAKGRWYRVRVGPFATEQEAQRALARIQRERSLKGFIVR